MALIQWPASMLTGVVAYSPRAPIRLRLRLGGARVLEQPDSATITHAVLPRSSLMDGSCAQVRRRLSAARLAATAHGACSDSKDGSAGAVSAKHGYAWLVEESWLRACEADGRRAEERKFELHEGVPQCPAPVPTAQHPVPSTGEVRTERLSPMG